MSRRVKLVIILMVAVILYFCATIGTAGQPVPFAFIKEDHPVEMLYDKGAAWLYYDFLGAPTDFIDSARNELSAHGYREDFSKKPWYYFVDGDREVIISGKNDVAIQMDGSNSWPIYRKQTLASTIPYTQVWVRQIHRTKLACDFFRLKKTVLFW
jgi:hypothetical protein